MDAKAEIFLAISVGMIMLSMGLGLTSADFRRIGDHPRAVGLGMLGQLVLLPALAFTIAHLSGLPGPLAVGLVLIAACPGGAHSNLYASFARADVALSVTLTALSGLLTIVTIPLIVGLAISLFAVGEIPAVPVGKTVIGVVLVMAAPVGLGMLIRGRSEGVARRLATIVKIIAVGLLVLIVVGSVSQNASRMPAHLASSGLPALALNVSAMGVGLALGRLGGLPLAQQLTLSLEVGIQNATLAFGLAVGITHDYALLPPIIVYSLLVYATGLLAIAVGRLRLPRMEVDGSPDATIER